MLVQETFPMIEVSIASLERMVDESGKPKKLYRVDVLFNGRKHCVLRRHSEFQTLHRKLRKIVQIPDFPSKRNPHLRTKPLEQRRQELEDYIQDILYQYEDVPKELLDFLHVRHFHTGIKVNSMEVGLLDQKFCCNIVGLLGQKFCYNRVGLLDPRLGHTRSLDDLEDQGYSYQLPHQRVLGFFEDPYLTGCTSTGLPDMVVNGVLEGFYPRDVRVSFTACTKDAAGDIS